MVDEERDFLQITKPQIIWLVNFNNSYQYFFSKLSAMENIWQRSGRPHLISLKIPNSAIRAFKYVCVHLLHTNATERNKNGYFIRRPVSQTSSTALYTCWVFHFCYPMNSVKTEIGAVWNSEHGHDICVGRAERKDEDDDSAVIRCYWEQPRDQRIIFCGWIWASCLFV